MAYFVTGATGFIGQFLVRNLGKRGKPIFVLVRKGSQKKLEALRESWGEMGKNVIPVVGDLAKPKLGVSDAAWRVLDSSASPCLTRLSNMRMPSACAREKAPRPASQMLREESTVDSAALASPASWPAAASRAFLSMRPSGKVARVES